MKYTEKERDRIVRAAERYVMAELRRLECAMSDNAEKRSAYSKAHAEAFTVQKKLQDTLVRIWGSRPAAKAPAKGKARRG